MVHHNTKAILLNTAYFPPLQYLSKFVLFEKVYIEQFENYTKQTYRNRCEILGANGPVSLIVPVVKGRSKKIKIKDLQISYDNDWQRNHWRTLFSAYNASPFFEFYKDDILPFFEKRRKYLLDLNLGIHEMLCGLMEIDTHLNLTNNFEDIPENTLNYREFLSPKKNKTLPDPLFQPQEYTQVFSEKFDFISNLSILDLLFNEGPNSIHILEQSTLHPD
jgi:hypothetical protein